MHKLSIIGIGGQGVAILGQIIGIASTNQGKYASVHSSYGAEVRGGRVETHIIISDKPITNPYTREMDTYILLHKVGWREISKPISKEIKIYADKDLAHDGKTINQKQIIYLPLNQIAITYNVPINMVTLGFLIKLGYIDIDNAIKALKTRRIYNEKNVKAIKLGMSESNIFQSGK